MNHKLLKSLNPIFGRALTVSEPGHPVSDDPLASERLAMVGQLVVAQFDLETAIAALMRSGGDAATAQTQLQNIAQLRQQIGTASPTSLAALRSEIVAAVAQSQSAVQEARTAASGAGAADGATVASLANRAQAQASSFMRDVRQYDDLLQFDNDADRDAYRQREDERRKRYEAEAAKGAPESALNANGAALGQMADLATHGGSADPALMRRMDELTASTAALREKIIQEGGDISKFDEGLRADLRAIMKSKGIPDEKIDALLAEYRDNPINAMKAFVAEHQTSMTAKDFDAIEKTTDNRLNNDRALRFQNQTVEQSAPVLQAGMTTAALDAMAEFKASGVVVADHDIAAPPAHGVTAQVVSAANAKIALS